MAKPLTPPLTGLHVGVAVAVALITSVIVVSALISAGDLLSALRWIGAVIVIGCIQFVLVACSLQYYFRHQKKQAKAAADKARFEALIAQAERFTRE